MDLKDVTSAVAKFAPALGSLVGPEGTLIGGALSAVLKVFGLAGNSTPDQIVQTIEQDPQSALKLKMAEMDYQLAVTKEENASKLATLQAQLTDVQNARSREVETTKATGKRDLNLYVLAWVIMGGFLGLIAALVIMQALYKFVLASDPLVTLLLGSLSTDAGMVVGYFFGSSKGSDDKTELLAKAQPIK